MPMDAMVTAVIEASLNQLLNLDKQSPARLRKLAGKVLKLELRELKPLWFVFSERRLDVLARFEGEADAVLSLSLTALGLLKEPSALTRYIREEKLDLSGDPQLVQAFSALLGELEMIVGPAASAAVPARKLRRETLILLIVDVLPVIRKNHFNTKRI
jgi:ubiquinone biosynthesis protein UbiJ